MNFESKICGPYTLFPFQNGSASLCFLDVIWTGINLSILLLFGIKRLLSLRSSPEPSHGTIKINGDQLIRYIGMSSSCLSCLLRSSSSLFLPSFYLHSFLLDFMQISGWIFVLFISRSEHVRSAKTSWIVRVWITFTFLGEGLRLSSLYEEKRGSREEFHASRFVFSLLCCLTAALTNVMVLYFDRVQDSYQKLNENEMEEMDGERRETDENGGQKGGCPMDNANLISKLTFWWVNRVMALGYKRPLMFEDLYESPENLDPQYLDERFRSIWEEEIKKERPSLFKAYYKRYRWEVLRASTIKWTQDFALFLGPWFLNRIVEFVASDSEDLLLGSAYVLGMCLGAIWQVLSLQFFWFKALIIAKKIEIDGINCIYKKALFLSSKSRGTQSVGEITNLQSVDMGRINEFAFEMYSVPTAVIQITVAMVFLWKQLGVSSLAGIVVLLVSSPLNAFLSKKMSKYQEEVMSIKDSRTKAMAEILNGIRIIKFFTWEDPYALKISQIREKEVKTMRDSVAMRSFADFFWMAAPVFVAVSTFSVYSNLGNTLTASKAFTSLALFNIIRHPLTSLPGVIYKAVEASVSFKRLGVYFASQELDLESVDHSENLQDPVAISVEDGSWQWTDDGFALEEVNFQVPRGKLVAVVGTVGSGKSTLLSGLLGDAPKIRGNVRVSGKLAYVSQQAWIKNDTVKGNILFGSEYDAKRYKRAVKVSELESDLKVLTNGDMTEIGEKGINLSGGQKQRVSIARAVYQNADVILMDDCLSAVDAHVGKSIFEKCILGELRGKTRILVTHQLQYLHAVDMIIVLKEGFVSEIGSYRQLMEKKGGEFRNLIETHVSDQSKDEQDSTHSDDANLKMSAEILRKSMGEKENAEKVEKNNQN
eukprot:TRINITY_DN6113_c0_g1_i1.p1 TRINITY_DN6113_c0_g1~~TRINITY_DN6113_c0_g1_i1.p1  ORF type:complete len:878 (-),score=276.65 TRINITY_DN6113_c0_g1_i1:12-2645(-)